MNKQEMDRCLRRMQTGDQQAFAQLYEGTKKGVYAFLYPYYGERTATEDGVQNVYIRVKERILQYRSGLDARGWLLQIAKNAALNELRKRKRESVPGDEVLDRVAGGEGLSEGTAFEALNRALKEDEREVVILHVLWGYKHRETAAMLGLPLGTVTSKYQTAIRKMREFLEEES